MLGDFIRNERGVHSAHHHRHTARPVLARDLIGASGRVGLDADGNQIGRLVERDGLESVVVEADLDVAQREVANDVGRVVGGDHRFDTFLEAPNVVVDQRWSDPEQRRDHQQDAAGDIGGHELFRLLELGDNEVVN